MRKMHFMNVLVYALTIGLIFSHFYIKEKIAVASLMRDYCTFT